MSSAASTAVANSANVAKATEAPKDVSEEQIKKLRTRGFELEVQNGITVFCRREVILGSRFERKFCGTAADIDKATLDSRDLVENVQRTVQVR